MGTAGTLLDGESQRAGCYPDAMKYAWLLCGTGALVAGLQACSEGSIAPFSNGGAGPVSGTHGGGGSRDGGSSGGGRSDAAARDLLGRVYLTETPQAPDGGGVNKTSVVAEFLSGVAVSDAGVQLPTGCTRSQASVGQTTCSRIDCDQAVSSEPVGTPVSAGRLQFSGMVGLEGLEPNGTTYPATESADVPFWQGGNGLGVETVGDTFPAFSTTLSAPAPMNLSAPVAQIDGRRLLSRSTGFTFRTGVSVSALRLTLGFVVAGRQLGYECTTAGGVELQIPSELVADLPDDATPQSGLLFGEEAVEQPVDDRLEDIGRVVVAARRVVGDESGGPLSWSAFVVQP